MHLFPFFLSPSLPPPPPPLLVQAVGWRSGVVLGKEGGYFRRGLHGIIPTNVGGG